MDLTKIAIDGNKEKNGVWVELDEETQLLIGRINSPQFTRLAASLRKPYARQIENNLLSDKKKSAIAAKLYSETVLLGWNNLKIDGQDVPYSKPKCKEILADDRFQPFFQIVSSFANDEDLFHREEIAEIVGEQQPI